MAKGKGPGKKRKISVDIEKLGKAPKSKPKSTASVPQERTTEPVRSPLDVNFKHLILFGCGVATLAILAYINTISSTIVFQDRTQLLPFVTTVDWDAFWSSLGKDALTKPFTQPWVRFSYALDWNNYKSTLSWFHSANAAVHTLTAIYVYALTWGVSRRWKLKEKAGLSEEFLAFSAAAIFAVHPFTSETVTYLSSRSPLLATNNFMLALNTFLVAVLAGNWRIKAWSWLLTVAAVYMCVTSGTEALALPAAMLLTLWAVKPEKQGFADWVYWRLPTFVICVVALLGLPFLLVLGVTHPTGTSFALDILSPPAYLQAQLCGLIVYYLPKFFVPFGLSVDPQYGWSNVLHYATIAGLAVTMTVGALCVKFRQMPFVSYGLAFTVLTLLPHVILVQPQAVADSVFYLPMIGLCFLLGGLFAIACKQDLRAGIGSLSVVVIALLALTIWRNTEWASDLALFESTARASEKSSRAHAMLAMELTKQRKNDKAKEHAERAVKLDQTSPLALIAKGDVDLQLKDYVAAEKEFQTAIESSKTRALPRELTTAAGLGLAESYVRQHKPDKALTVLVTVAQNAKGDPRASLIAGLATAEQKNWSKAFPYLRQAVQLNPDSADLWAKLAEASLAVAAYRDALQAAMMAEQLEPTTSSKVLLARASFANSRTDEGMKLLNELAKKEPKNAEVLGMLSLAYQRSKNAPQAEKYKAQALAIDPHIFSKISFREVDLPQAISQPSPPDSNVQSPKPTEESTTPKEESTTPKEESTQSTKTTGSSQPPTKANP